MANERPSARPNGYWLASNPASMPAHAIPEWLLNALLAGHDFESEEFPGAPPAFPVNAPSQGPTQGYEDSEFAGNALLGPGQRRPQQVMARPALNALRLGGG